jgi:hypothetical protein
MRPNITKAPSGATHWAPEQEAYNGGWYRIEGDKYHFVCEYWASSITDHPHGVQAQRWFKGEGKPLNELCRPLTDLIPLEQLK